MESKTVYIYGLWDPRTLELRYIGKAENLKGRLNDHIRSTKNNRNENLYKEGWIRQLLLEGIKPTIEILEECTEGTWREAERAWIREAREKGVRLTNITEGGEGFGSGENHPMFGRKHTPEALKKISLASTGRTVSEEAKRKISKANKGKTPFKGKKLSDEAKAKISKANTGKPGTNLGKKFSEEHKKRISDSHKGKVSFRRGQTLSEEHRKRIVEALTGRKLSPEHIEKIKQAKSNVSEETRRKISEGNKGKKLSEEHRAILLNSKGMLGKHHSQETKEKISKAQIGKPGPNKGKVFSKEHRENISKSHMRHNPSEEARRNMSESAKRAWQKRKENKG